MRKILSILAITIGGFLLMLVIGMILFGVDGPSDQTTNSTTTPQDSSETARESTSKTQETEANATEVADSTANAEAKPNESRKSLEKAYSQMIAIEQRLNEIKGNNYQVSFDEVREIDQQADPIADDVTAVIQDDLTADGFEQVIKSGTNTSPISAMERAILNLYDLANDPTSKDALDNFNGNLEEFSANIPKVRAVLDQDELWEGTK